MFRRMTCSLHGLMTRISPWLMLIALNYSNALGSLVWWYRVYSENIAEFCIINDGLCIKNSEFCIATVSILTGNLQINDDWRALRIRIIELSQARSELMILVTVENHAGITLCKCWIPFFCCCILFGVWSQVCAQAAAALLYPFQWQHIFVPILPQSWIDYITAPMPFVCGVHDSMLEEVLNQPIEDSMLFMKLDTGESEDRFDYYKSGILYSKSWIL